MYEKSMGELDVVIELDNLYSELDKKQKSLNDLPSWMQSAYQEYLAKKEEYEHIKSKKESLESQLREAELRLNELEESYGNLNERASKISNMKQYEAYVREKKRIKEEIEKTKSLKNDISAEIELFKENFAEVEASFLDVEKTYKKELAKWEASKPEIAREIETIEKKINELRSLLPPNIVRRLELLREKFGRATAKIYSSEDNQFSYCSNCNYVVRPVVIQRIKLGIELIECDNCKRILYQ